MCYKNWYRKNAIKKTTTSFPDAVLSFTNKKRQLSKRTIRYLPALLFSTCRTYDRCKSLAAVSTRNAVILAHNSIPRFCRTRPNIALLLSKFAFQSSASKPPAIPQKIQRCKYATFCTKQVRFFRIFVCPY